MATDTKRQREQALGEKGKWGCDSKQFFNETLGSQMEQAGTRQFSEGKGAGAWEFEDEIAEKKEETKKRPFEEGIQIRKSKQEEDNWMCWNREITEAATISGSLKVPTKMEVPIGI